MDLFGINIPIKIGSSAIGTTLLVVLAIVIFVFILGIGIYFYYTYRVYNKKIVVFEDIAGGGYKKAFTDRARLVKIGDGGEEVLKLLKRKVFRAAYGKKMGTNEYWFAIGQDGYWYNCLLGDLDAEKGMLDIEPIEKDMRYTYVAIQKSIQNDYTKTSFMQKYGTMVMGGIFLIIMIAGIWFLLSEISGIAKEVSGAVNTAAEVQRTSADIISSLDNIVTGGAGVIPAG